MRRLLLLTVAVLLASVSPAVNGSEVDVTGERVGLAPVTVDVLQRVRVGMTIDAVHRAFGSRGPGIARFLGWLDEADARYWFAGVGVIYRRKPGDSTLRVASVRDLTKEERG